MFKQDNLSYIKNKQNMIIWSEIVYHRTIAWEQIKHSLLIMIFCETTFTQSYIPVMFVYINTELVNELPIEKYLRLSLWCNGYHHRKWTLWPKFKFWTKLFAFHIVLRHLRKVLIQLLNFQLWVNSWADWAI